MQSTTLLCNFGGAMRCLWLMRRHSPPHLWYFPPALSKQVHWPDPHCKRLVASNWPSITCDLHKTLQVYIIGWITRKCDTAYCYGSASEKLQGSYVRSERWRVAPGLPLNCSILHQMLLPPSFCVRVLCSFILPELQWKFKAPSCFSIL